MKRRIVTRGAGPGFSSFMQRVLDGTDPVKDWNRKYTGGTAVILVNDDGQEERTFTRSNAWRLGDGTPVIKVHGRTGCYALSRIRPVYPVTRIQIGDENA